ncbi:MAG: hypothetical protein R3E82_13110 [Pseudomonadales bacterium]
MEDVLGFAAFGGLERVAIIAGALLVGYWGYRLYVAGKGAGLAFLGIACVVLFGALLTGGSHLRTVGESIQLASSRSHSDDAGATDAAARLAQIERAAMASAAADHGTADISPVATSPGAAAAKTVAASEGAGEKPASATDTPPQLDESAAAVPAAADTVAEADVANADRPDTNTASRERLPTAQELGGRIVSVKSDNISLEWSPAAADQ